MTNCGRDDADRKPQLTRRDLLQAKLGRVFDKRVELSEETASAASEQPRVMRYPRSAADVTGSDNHQASGKQTPETGPSVKGISIGPVQRSGKFSHSRPGPSRTIPVFRPPGAIAEQAFLEGCTRCGECLKACPHDAIVQAPDRLRAVAGTPVLEPDSQPCLMCAGFPCITACEPGVLTDSLPTMMGTARVTEHLCLAHHGTPCTVCSERCPVDEAIAVNDGKPTIREEVCTGCGVCRYVCPAPENAILLMPTFNRPAAPVTDTPTSSRETQ